MIRTCLSILLIVVSALLAGGALAASGRSAGPAQPRCFGAAERDPARPCRNPRLRAMVRPTPAEARLTPNAPCRPVERIGQVGICAFGVPESRATASVALIGDSHAVHWRAAVDVVAREKGWHAVSLHQTGCSLSTATKRLPEPLFSECIRWKTEVNDWLTNHPEVSIVVVSHLISRIGVVPRDGQTMFETTVDGYAEAWSALPRSVKQVIVIRDNPKVGYRTLACVERARRAGRPAGLGCAVPRRIALERDAAAAAVSRLRSVRVHLVDLSHFFCGRRRCFPVIGGALVYKDGHHLTRVYARTLGPILLRRIERLATASATTAPSPFDGHDTPVPILMYHQVAVPPATASRPSLWVRPSRFARQVAALARAGYEGVTLEQVWRHWHEGAALPAKPVVLSFDDGYRSHDRVAARILKRQGWPGVLNLWVRRLGAPGGLERAEVRQMIRDGWEVDAHSLTHPDLTKVGARRLRREVAGSRSEIRRIFGVPASFFSFPGGRFNAAVRTAVRAAGFRGATTTLPGLASPYQDPYALRRITVRGGDSPAALLAVLRTADELHRRDPGPSRPAVSSRAAAP